MNKTMTKKLQDIQENYENAVEGFNFYKVKLVMQALDWTWGGSTDSPTIFEMENCVHRLYENALAQIQKGKSNGYCASGGFVVQIYESNGVSIEFVAEESE